MLDWLTAGIVVFLTGLIFALVLVLAWYLSPTGKYYIKYQVYECGILPTHDISTFNIRFYIIAILFTLFDIEAIFLYPWAVDFRSLGTIGVIEMFLFLFLVFLGWIYAYKKGALEWQ